MNKDPFICEQLLLLSIIIEIKILILSHGSGICTLSDAPPRERWVFGLFDTQFTPARPYLQLVRRRNAATLLPIIQAKVQPGSLVYSDQWAAYRNIQRRLGLYHRAVNHSLHFVDPATGVHTQHAESGWCGAKDRFKRMKGNTNPNFLQEYLQEFMWRWLGDPHRGGCFQRLIQDIAEQNPL